MSLNCLERAVSQVQGERVLIAPLNWGLGHATRCVPIIKCLLNNGKKVFIAGSGVSFSFLKKEFTNLEHIDFPSLSITYSTSSSQVWAIMKQIPYILFQIIKEHFLLKRIIKQYDIHAVISDNRFGLWNKSVMSIYITHQIMVRLPKNFRFFEGLICRLHKFFISHYDVCWIPDFAGENNLSGDLSHKYPVPKNAIFIGWLSRFNPSDFIDKSPYKNLAIVSGPEPQRTIFEQELLVKLIATGESSLLVQGKPNIDVSFDMGCVRIVSHIDTNTLQFLLQKTPMIYCRSGYSTLMDLSILQRKAVLIPTQGQTEQEYLAEYNKSRFSYSVC